MALAAAQEILGPQPAELSDVRFSRALVLASDPLPEIRLELTTEGTDRASFEIFSVTSAGGDPGPLPHASGMVRLATADKDGDGDAAGQAAAAPGGTRPPGGESPGGESPGGESLGGESLYAALRQAGLGYGPAFQRVAEIRQGDGLATGRIELPEEMATEAGRYLMHPAVLDSCFQVLAAAASEAAAGGGTFVPVALERLSLSRQPGSVIFSHARTRPAADEAGQIAGEITVTDESGRLVLSVQGLVAARIAGPGTGHDDPSAWLYTLDWELSEPMPDEQAGPLAAPSAAAERWLVLADDRGVGAALAASGDRSSLVAGHS